MPSGKVHDRIWKISLFPVLVFNVVVLGSLSFYIRSSSPMAFIIGYLLGSFIEPDLDQLAITTSEGRLLRWFKDLGALVIGYFTWYAYRFKHRGISHYPIVGTATRWMWIMTPLMIIWVIGGDYENFEIYKNGWFWWMFLGNCFSDLLHIGADYKWKVFHIYFKIISKIKIKKGLLKNVN